MTEEKKEENSQVEAEKKEDKEIKVDEAAEEMEELLKDVELPEPTLTAFILRLRAEAFMYLGEGFEEKSEKKQAHPKLAKYTIDTIAMLDEKTKANQTPEEKDLITNVLTDLRLRYVKVAS